MFVWLCNMQSFEIICTFYLKSFLIFCFLVYVNLVQPLTELETMRHVEQLKPRKVVISFHLQICAYIL